MVFRGDSRLRAYAALAAAVGGVTWSAIFVRWAGTPGPVSAFYRVLIAAAILIPWRLSVTPAPRHAAKSQDAAPSRDTSASRQTRPSRHVPGGPRLSRC